MFSNSEMGVFIRGLCLIIIIIIKEVSLQRMKCNPGEYNINDECCPMCPPGNVVKNHCTTDKSTVCKPCTESTYMDHPNGVTKCLRCKQCDAGSGLLTKNACTYFSNTVCDCQGGYFCSTEKGHECELCQQHTECQPGEEVITFGTSRTDTQCRKCPEETFSHTSMSVKCMPWTKYTNKRLITAGTSSSDAIYSEKTERNRILLVMPPLLMVLLLIFIAYRISDSAQLSVEETATISNNQ